MTDVSSVREPAPSAPEMHREREREGSLPCAFTKAERVSSKSTQYLGTALQCAEPGPLPSASVGKRRSKGHPEGKGGESGGAAEQS